MSADATFLLERTAELAAFDEHLTAVTARPARTPVLIAGEAGIGKTALVRRVLRRSRGVRVLWGACDALHTPRPLGPLLDIADETRAASSATSSGAAPPPARSSRRSRTSCGRGPTIVVLEDLHWADEATLDLLRLLGPADRVAAGARDRDATATTS